MRLTINTFATCSPRRPLPWHHIFLDLSLVKSILGLNVAYSWQLQTTRLSWSLPLRFHPIFQSSAVPGSYVNSFSLKFHSVFITQVTGIKDTKPLVMVKNELNNNIKYTPISIIFFQKLKKGKFYLCIHSWKESQPLLPWPFFQTVHRKSPNREIKRWLWGGGEVA